MSQAGVLSDSSSPASDVETLTGNSGGAVGPDALFNINTLGTGSITVVGVPGTNTLTTQLTGLTNHNVLLGAGTATITSVAPSATSGIPLISQGAASDPLFGTAVVAGGGTGATSFNINGVTISNTTTTGALSALTLTNGQVVIGSTGAAPAAATLTAGPGISISNAANSITINNTSGGFTWNTVAGISQAISVQNGYINANAGLTTYTLPATGSVGDTFQLAGYGAGGWTIAQNAGQKIYIGPTTSTVGVGGSVSSTSAHDTVEIFCIVANTEWQVLDMIGTLTVV